MSFHDDALALGRESRAIELVREETEKKRLAAMIRADFKAAKKAIISWMTEIEMTPIPKVECKHLGDESWNTEGDKPINLARRVHLTWVFDSHHYVAVYKTDGRIFPIDIVISVNYPPNPEQSREIRGSMGKDWSIKEDKMRIGRALLEEAGDR
jgi:hypothetical protein